MAAMLQFPTKLPKEVIEAIEKAVEEKRYKSKNAAVVKALMKFFNVKKKEE